MNGATLTEHSLVCVICHQVQRIMVDEEDVERHRSGALAQSAFPYLAPPVREMFISGTCGACWTKMFPPMTR